VVEASLVYQLVEWTLYGSAWLGTSGKGVDSPKNHMGQEGALGSSRLTPPVKPQRVCYKIDQAVEKPCSDILAHTPKVCKGIPSDQRVPSYQG
jgi:hypothetical protein